MEKYAKAGVNEYWLVDARNSEPTFQIFLLRDGTYTPVAKEDGWLMSSVFNKKFKLEQGKDPLGHPIYQLLAR